MVLCSAPWYSKTLAISEDRPIAQMYPTNRPIRDQTVDHVEEHDRVVGTEESLGALGRQQRQHHEHGHEEDQGDDQRPDDVAGADLLAVLLLPGLAGRPGEGAHAQAQRLDQDQDTADERDLGPAATEPRAGAIRARRPR